MNVTLYAICKNEEKNVQKFIENSKKFYDTVVVDTGSTDDTVNLLRDAGITVYEHPQSVEEFDFAAARNKALSYVETEWAFSLDFNEDVTNFSPEKYTNEELSRYSCIKHRRYDDNDGYVKESYEVHVRFHRKDNYKWMMSVHEQPRFIESENISKEEHLESDIGITKKIFKTIDKELFYLSICERESEKNPNDSFYCFFIFNHYYNTQNFQKALEYGSTFLNNSVPYFDFYRIQIFIKMSVCFINLNNYHNGVNFAFFAFSEALNSSDDSIIEDASNYLSHVGKIMENEIVENLGDSIIKSLKNNIRNKNED